MHLFPSLEKVVFENCGVEENCEVEEAYENYEDYEDDMYWWEQALAESLTAYNPKIVVIFEYGCQAMVKSTVTDMRRTYVLTPLSL